jgi:sulfhydrogenase subunit beta (sulfur reductase)
VIYDFKLKKSVFYKAVDLMIEREPKVAGVIAKGDDFVFTDIEKAEELRLDYNKPTILPPNKKYLLPAREKLAKFDTEKTEVAIEAPKTLIIGVKPYDLWAIKLMDEIFIHTDPVDPNYKARRENLTIIAVNDFRPAQNSFCASMGTDTINQGFDLMLTDLDDNYIITIGSKEGEKVLAKYFPVETMKDVTDTDRIIIDCKRGQAEKKYILETKITPSDLPKFLESKFDSPIWEELAKKCLSCGKCNIVCPTCVCFDIQDRVEFDLTTGTRERMIYSCVIPDFAEVAMGHNFRSKTEQRLRHRIYRKLSYLFSRYGLPGCVGCGRCANSCKAEIANPAEIIEKLKKEKKSE